MQNPADVQPRKDASPNVSDDRTQQREEGQKRPLSGDISPDAHADGAIARQSARDGNKNPEQRTLPSKTAAPPRYIPVPRAGEIEMTVKPDSALSDDEKRTRQKSRLSLAGASRGGIMMLSSFENEEDFRLWSYSFVRPFRGLLGVDDGKVSLRLVPEPCAENPTSPCSVSIMLEPGTFWDLSNGNLLRFSAYNDSGEPLELLLSLKWQGAGGPETYAFKFTLDKKTKHDMSALLSEASNDLGKVCGLEFSFPRGDSERPRVLYLDNIRIEMKQ